MNEGSNMKSMVKDSSRTGQRGAAAVEFALIAMVFFMLFFGIIEFGRFFYLYNTVQEVTRCAARQAVVRWTDQVGGIQRMCVFQPGSAGDVSLPGAPEVTNVKVSIRFVNASGATANPMPGSSEDNVGACLDPGADGCIRFVEASIQDCSGQSCQPVQYQPMIGLFSYMGINIPISTVRMPVESLGYRS